MSEEKNGWKLNIQESEGFRDNDYSSQNLNQSVQQPLNEQQGVVSSNPVQENSSIEASTQEYRQMQLQSPRENIFQKIFSKKVLIIATLVLGVFVLSGGSIFAYISYNKKFGKVSIEKILPANPNIVMKISLDPDAEQFKLLESNLEKFPGYDDLKRELGENGEKRTLSGIIQDELKKKGLDFQEDIKSVISEKAYLIISDAKPLVNNIGDLVALSFIENKKLFALEESEKNGTVLGINDEKKTKDATPVDFILGSEIKDMKKAKETLEKIKKDGKYYISEKKHEGYQYYELKIKKDEKKSGSDNYSGNVINYNTTFHALVGMNWVVSSNENLMKDMIDRRNSDEFLSFSEDKFDSLENDEKFRRIGDSMNKELKNNLIDVYYNFDLKKFFDNDSCKSELGCNFEFDGMFKRPDEIVGGFSVRLEKEGVEIISSTNKMTAEDVDNIDSSKSLANKIPQKVGEKWTDVFVENGNIKGFYYNLKKNNLSEEAVADWNEGIDDINNMTGIHIEKDFIDLISGSGAFVGFAKKDSFPAAAMVFEISEPERMHVTMKKIFEMIKTFQIEVYSSQINSYESLIAMYKQPAIREEPFSYSYRGDEKNEKQRLIAKYQGKLERSKRILGEVKKISIIEENTPLGKIYSYKLNFDEEFSFIPKISLSYAIENGNFIFSIDDTIVKDLVSGIKNGGLATLSSSDPYKNATKYYEKETYASTFIATQGVANAIGYIANVATEYVVNQQLQYIDQNDEALKHRLDSLKNEIRYAYAVPLGILRTMKYVGSYNSSAGDSIKASVFINIVELPSEEKKLINEMIVNMGSMDRASRMMEGVVEEAGEDIF